MRKIIVANWKMNPGTLGQAKSLARSYSNNRAVDIVVCPPTIFLQQLHDTRKDLLWGAQESFWENSGAYTGQLSPRAIKLVGAKYVMLGHSESREYGHETDREIGKKFKAVLKVGLKPILCVGGGPEGKKRNANAKSILKRHIAGVLKGNTLKKVKDQKLNLVYEPPWALSNVSGNKPAPIKFIRESMDFIQKIMKAYKLPIKTYKLLYGGSVNGENIRQFANQDYLDGLLVGGASHQPKEFNKMVKIVSSS